jgi:5'-nucleotidase/UDP-sugar diphosphatase
MIITRIIFLSVLLVSADLFAGEKEITILHTNDLHSHVLGFSPNIDYRPDMTGGDSTKGGWPRVATVLKREREKRNHPVLVLDAGDFLMGSLFHMLAREEAMELRPMKGTMVAWAASSVVLVLILLMGLLTVMAVKKLRRKVSPMG